MPEDILIRISPNHLRTFRVDLIDRFDEVQRDMPWRRTHDPYRIWLSEIMLQQTRVDQAQPYFERFTAAFPTVDALAAADLDDVLRLWEGLGYYSRARNLHKAARMIVDQYAGRFPETYDGLLRLPGVGAYTAAAVASIAFDLPHAVLDGNVIRVLTRVFAIEEEVGLTKTRKRLQQLADALLEPARPGDYNQALMELGATVCTPSSPACPRCPLQPVCEAFETGTPLSFPVKKKKAPVPHYDIAAGLIFNDEGLVLIQRRPEDKMLGGLWEFPGGKREPGETLEATCHREIMEELGIEVTIDALFATVSHAYSHFKITLYAYRCRLHSGIPQSRENNPMRWVTMPELADYAFPRANRRIIDALIAHQHNPTLFDTG